LSARFFVDTVSLVVNIVNFRGLLDVVVDHFLEHLEFNFGESTVVVELVVDLPDFGEVIFSDKNWGLFTEKSYRKMVVKFRILFLTF
jgi:hypothetical protein